MFQDLQGHDWYVWIDTAVRPYVADMYAVNKHLTDSHAAAEYYRARSTSLIRVYQRDERGNIIDKRGEGWEYEHEVMLRFATSPHYDEADQ
jgi:hypothetical protein